MRKRELAVNYDQRYQQGYMADFRGLYETCRLAAVRQTLRSRRLFPAEPTVVADIACGGGEVCRRNQGGISHLSNRWYRHLARCPRIGNETLPRAIFHCSGLRIASSS